MKKILSTILIGVIILGFAQLTVADPKGEKEPIDKITFIHYRDGKIKVEGKPLPTKGGLTCYKLLGIKWKQTINFVINPANYDPNFVVSAITAAANEWYKYTLAFLFNFDNVTTSNSAQWGDKVDTPEYVFGKYPDEKVIGVTTIWYKKITKEIVDYDVLFNTYYSWKDCSNDNCNEENKGMDLQNIATHETGHGLGLGDVYQKACNEVTMYGYSDYGETIKRDLAGPDITAIQTLYGK